jgi:adenine-specific DNA-methyltransferase
VQIGDENVHRVRAVLDEVFGDENYISEIGYHSTSGSTSDYLSNPKDYVLWYAKSIEQTKFRKLLVERAFSIDDPGPWQTVERNVTKQRLSDFITSGGSISDPNIRIARMGDATSQRQGREAGDLSAMGFPFVFHGKTFRPSGTRGWSTTEGGLVRASKAGRLYEAASH